MSGAGTVARHVAVGNVTFGNDLPLVLIAGECQIENRDQTLETADVLVKMAERLGIGFIYKSSFDKANRTSIKTNRGVGMEEGLKILSEVRERSGCPVLTDVHSSDQCESTAEAVDVLQIPAFLCRQTDLVVAAAKTGKAMHVKKGQFLAPQDMANVADKISTAGNDNILLCERGVSFGYNALVSDMRSLPIMARTGYPVTFDATHSVQQPGGQGTASGGDRRFAPVLARAAVAVGVAGVFMETHKNPDKAPSDGPNMIYLKDLAGIVETLMSIDALAKADPVSVP